MDIVRAGSLASQKGPPATFTGDVRIDGLFQRAAPGRVGGAVVTFEPGARTAWHTHPLGQTLLVTSGVGSVQMEGQPRQVIRAGDTVLIPPNVRHWHGATLTTAMTHTAIQESQNGSPVNWLGHVTDQQYRAGAPSPTSN